VYPAVATVADTRPMAENATRLGCAIYDINIGPLVTYIINITTADKVVREVLFHIFPGDSGDTRFLTDPVAHLQWEIFKGNRQFYRPIDIDLITLPYNTIGSP